MVTDTLISRPSVMKTTDDYVQEHLPTHPDHFYDVHRYHLHAGRSLHIATENRSHDRKNEEGRKAEVATADGRRERNKNKEN